jgi:Holliday junction DNA helicase RuvA
MYAYICGVVAEVGQDRAIIDCHGVGYEIYTNPASLQALQTGKEARLHTHLIVRDDAHTLYGFLQHEDKEMFGRLITVGGIGPRLGLAALSVLSAPQIAMAILSDDETLVRVPGLGKKTAQRLILELKGKLKSEHALIDAGVLTAVEPGGAVDEAIAILTAMGFAPQDSAAAVALVCAEGGTPEQMAMNALRRLDRNA